MRQSRRSTAPGRPNKQMANFLNMDTTTENEPEDEWNFFKAICFFRVKPALLTSEELQQHIIKLNKYCLIHLVDSYKVHLNRLKGVKLVNEIISRVVFEDITPTNVMSLVWCMISCVHHFYIRLRIGKGPMAWARRRQARKAMKTFESLMALLLPYHIDTVTHSIITFYTEAHMWNTEYICAELLKRLFRCSEDIESAVHAVLDLAEKSSLNNIKDARQILRVLYEVFETYTWTEIEEDLLARLLTMYHKSIMPSDEDVYNYSSLRKGLEVCIRHILENLPNKYLLKMIQIMLQWTFEDAISDEALLDFGNVVEYAVLQHKMRLYRDSLHNSLFPMILKLIASDNRLHSLLGNRVLQQLMDRQKNRKHFDTPRIYFQNTHFNITLGEYASEDKTFIRRYREMIHATMLGSIQLHGRHRINLESTYTSIAIILVEVPCGYTAAAVVCLAMAIQETTLQHTSHQPLECTHRLHATVTALISLVCWVHDAEVFYEYLYALLSRRAQFAPHLNPPLRTQYQYALHHVLWNKPELFFEDWEARYGLWKCFRTKREIKAKVD